MNETAMSILDETAKRIDREERAGHITKMEATSMRIQLQKQREALVKEDIKMIFSRED